MQDMEIGMGQHRKKIELPTNGTSVLSDSGALELTRRILRSL